MEQKKYRVKRGGWSGFFLFLFGILCGIIIVGLVGVWAFKSVSITKVEGWFNVKIDLGSANGLKDMTMEELVALGIDYGGNINNVTLQDIENDFGITISSPISGIDISELKTKPIMSLDEHLDLITDQVTFGKLEGWFDELSLPDIPIITDNVDEPIMDAINTLFDTVNKGTDMTMADLKDFGIDLSTISLLDGVSDTTRLSELEAVVKDKKVSDLIEITASSNAVLKAIADYKINQLSTELPKLTIGKVIGDTTTTTGIIGKIKDIQIGNLNESTLMDKVKTLTLSEIMDTSGNAILTALASTQIGDMSSAINNLSISVVLGESGVVTLLNSKDSNGNVTLQELPNAISTTFDMDTLTLGDLVTIDPDVEIPEGHENVTIKAVIDAYTAYVESMGG